MSVRKCIYTGLKATAKDSVIPKKDLGEEVHNWANGVPVSEEYKNIKKDRSPNELELEAQEIFFKIELAKLKVLHYEHKLSEIQEKLKQTLPPTPVHKVTNKIKKEIKLAVHEKEVIQSAEKGLDEKLEKRKKKIMWD